MTHVTGAGILWPMGILRRVPSVLSLLAGLSLEAQPPRQLRLPPANAQLAEEFTLIGSVRELPDGRVLLNDPRDGRVVVADLKSGVVQQVGRKGQGPNEYSNAGPLHALAGDSTLLFDGQTRRWLLFAGSSIVVTLPPDAPAVKATKAFVRGADRTGNVWFLSTAMQFAPEKPKAGITTFGAADSDVVVRVHRGTAKLDTITKLRGAISRQSITLNPEGKISMVSLTRAPLASNEEAALFNDGWFAIARLEPYRVDWIGPDGRVSNGRPLPFTPIKVSSAEKEAWFARREAARDPRMGPPPEALRREQDALLDQFPEAFPPFSGGLIAAGDGNVWLRHPVSMNFLDARYDVVDRSGRLVGVLALAKGERIVSVSKTAVYVAWKDEDDIERLRRHPLPY